MAPPGTDEAEFEAIVRAHLYDVDMPVSGMPGDDDQASPARKRYRKFAERTGAAGFNVGAVVRLLEAENVPASKSTVHRWLKEDEAAGLVERMGQFGRWKWRQQ